MSNELRDDLTEEQLDEFLKEAEAKIPDLDRQVKNAELHIHYKRNALRGWIARRDEIRKKLSVLRKKNAMLRWQERVLNRRQQNGD